MSGLAEEIDAEMKFYENEFFGTPSTPKCGNECGYSNSGCDEAMSSTVASSRRGGSFDSTDEGLISCFDAHANKSTSHMLIEFQSPDQQEPRTLTLKPHDGGRTFCHQESELLDLFPPRPIIQRPANQVLAMFGSQATASSQQEALRPAAIANILSLCQEEQSPLQSPATSAKRNRRTNNPKILKSVGLQGQEFHDKLKQLFLHHTALADDDCPLYREVLSVCFDQVVTLPNQKILLAKFKRFDQFEKRTVSALKTKVYAAFQSPKRDRTETKREICAHFGISSDHLFNGFLGETTKNGLRNHVVDGVLHNKQLFDFVFCPEFMDSLLKYMNAETECDIVTSVVTPASAYFAQQEGASTSGERNLQFDAFRTHLHKGQNFKRPFTYMENILSIMYFLNKFEKRASKLQNISLREEREACIGGLTSHLEYKLAELCLSAEKEGPTPISSKPRDRLNFVRLVSNPERLQA